MGAQDARVSEEMAKKFATEKETPYTRWVHSEGLEIKSAIYQLNQKIREKLSARCRHGKARRKVQIANPRLHARLFVDLDQAIELFAVALQVGNDRAVIALRQSCLAGHARAVVPR